MRSSNHRPQYERAFRIRSQKVPGSSPRLVHSKVATTRTKSLYAASESQETQAVHTLVEPAKHRNAVPEWKQSPENASNIRNGNNLTERNHFRNWKQSSAAWTGQGQLVVPIRGIWHRDWNRTATLGMATNALH